MLTIVFVMIIFKIIMLVNKKIKFKKIILDNACIAVYNVIEKRKIMKFGRRICLMKTDRVIRYIDLEDKEHIEKFDEPNDATRFFMMITSERLAKRATLSDENCSK